MNSPLLLSAHNLSGEQPVELDIEDDEAQITERTDRTSPPRSSVAGGDSGVQVH